MTINEIIEHLVKTSGMTEEEVRNLPIGITATDEHSNPAFASNNKFGLFVQKDMDKTKNYIKMLVDVHGVGFRTYKKVKE
jgi:hypothetical protein